MGNSSDEELVSASLGGDVDSFMELCHRYYPSMVAIAHAILGDSHLADDAAQEAFARACRKLPGLQKPGRFAAWMAAICRNQAKDILRRSDSSESLGDRDVAQLTQQQNTDIPIVRRAMESLTTDAREVLYLKYRNNLSHEQIADLLNLSPQAVHGRLKRARQTVREYVELRRKRRLS